MKKFLGLLLLGFASIVFFAGGSVNAADDVIDLYPYDSLECSLASNECLNTKVGSDHWTVEYAGYRYHPVRGSVRYADDFIDADANSQIDINELTGISWTSFGTVFINNTAETKELTPTLNLLDRRDLTTGGRQDVWLHFDETGELVMFENAVNEYYIFNDGDMATPDWRLATTAEIDAYDTAVADGDPLVDTPDTIKAPIRMKMDDVDTDGYVLEPLAFVQMVNRFADTVLDPETAWSTIIAGNPVNVTLPSGWTILTFAYLDRSSNAKNLEYITTLPGMLAAGGLDPMVLEYTDQPASFTGLTLLDDDGVTPGTNIVVDYNGTFDLDPAIVASWLDMYNDSDEIINTVENLDYSVAISQEDVVLETINFTYDELTTSYTASAPVTVVDSSVFGAGYKATWSTTTPAGDLAEAVADIVIGVMPPKYTDVADRFIDQGAFIDLLGIVTADDGYGNDKTDSISISYPEGFNPYYPMPGEYEIDLTFTHHIHYDGVFPTITLNTTTFDFDGSLNVLSTDWDSTIAVYDDVTNLKLTTMSWGSSGVIIEVDGSGNVIRTVDRHNWDLVDVLGLNTPANASGMFDAWLAGLTLETDGFVIIVGYKLGDTYTAAKALAFGEPISYDMTQIPVFDYDIVTDTSYLLTVDDLTAPVLMVVNDNYKIYGDDFDSVNDAILANVVAYDFTDDTDDLSIYVSNTGFLSLGTPGTYTVEVTVEDVFGNTDIESFDVVVVLPKPTTGAVADQIQAAIDSGVITEDDVQALLDDQMLTQAEVQALIDAAIAAIPEPETGCGSSIANGSLVISLISIVAVFGGAFLLFRKK